MKIINAINETLEISDNQWQELLDMSVIDVSGLWLEPPYFDDSDVQPRYICWTFLAIGLDQTPGGLEINIELDKRNIH